METRSIVARPPIAAAEAGRAGATPDVTSGRHRATSGPRGHIRREGAPPLGNQALLRLVGPAAAATLQRCGADHPDCGCADHAAIFRQASSLTPAGGASLPSSVSRPGDPSELAAERFATRVLDASASAPEPAVPTEPGYGGAPSHVAPRTVADVPRIVNETVQGSGSSLDSTTRGFFEARLGVDLGHVRIHTGPAAEASSTAVQAHAFTVGSDIVFGRGRYSPTTDSGRRLIAHELAHAVSGPGVDLARQTDDEEERSRRAGGDAEAGVDAGQAGEVRVDSGSDATDAGTTTTSTTGTTTAATTGTTTGGTTAPTTTATTTTKAAATTTQTVPTTTTSGILPSGHTAAPPGMAACPDAPGRNLVVLACKTPALAPPPKEVAKLPTPVTSNFGGDADRIAFAQGLAACRAAREVKGVIDRRFASEVEAARKLATDQGKADTAAAIAAAAEGIDPKDRGAIARARAQAEKDAKKEAAKKIAAAQAAVTRQDVATVTTELTAKDLAALEADFSLTIANALGSRFGPGWLRQMQARLDRERARITKEKTALPKARKGEPPPTPRPKADVDKEIEAEMTDVRCDTEQSVLGDLEAIARAWAVGRREQVDFETIPQTGVAFQKGFDPTYTPAAADLVQIPAGVREGGASATLAGVAPEVGDFLTELEAAQQAVTPSLKPPFTASNRAGHGGGSWAGKGFSLDISIPAPRDKRGFWDPNAAAMFLMTLDATAKRFGARWRVLYNDFSVAQAVNKATGSRNVVFIGDSSGNLNWHGPAPLILHFHLDVEIPKGATATPLAGTKTGPG